MRNIVSAEWTKLLPHKGTWLLVWIYPIIFALILMIGLIGEPGMSKAAGVAKGWIGETTMVWHIASFPMGRYFIAAYIALVFAGEYGWNTLKLVLPHTQRWKLIAAKYAVAIGLLYAAWALAAGMTVVAEYAKTALASLPVPEGVTLGAILNGHITALLHGVAPLLLTAGYASLLAVVTRSTLAAFIASLVLITFDELFGKLIGLLSAYGMEWLSVPYRVLPGYHLDNFASWTQEGVGFQVKLASGAVVACSQTTSMLALAAWIIGLFALTFAIFRRQDVN